MFCVDASVFLSAAKGDEPYSKESGGFLDFVEREGCKIFVPEILIPEVATTYAVEARVRLKLSKFKAKCVSRGCVGFGQGDRKCRIFS